MKVKYKILSFLGLTSGAVLSIFAINQFIKNRALSKKLYSTKNSSIFSWRLGNIHYKKIGKGAPLLLIHDLDPASSTYEWNFIIDELAKNHTVYCLDLIGCGKSEKPNMTYTNFLYVQLISDFIKNIIGKRCSVIASNSSVPFINLACKNNPELFNKLIYISPENPDYGVIFPNKTAKTYKFILNTPILGTLFYNIAMSKRNIMKKFSDIYFYNANLIPYKLTDIYFETSHMGESPKYLYSSISCNYTKFNTKEAISSIDNSIIILTGEYDIEGRISADNYQKLNSSIELYTINNSKKFPQLENPNELLDIIKIYL